MKILYPLTDFVIWDLETTGFDPVKDRITEIAAVLIIDGKVASSYNVLVKTDVKIPDNVSKLTGITQEMLDKDGIDEETAWRNLATFMKDKPILGHNILAFDVKFLIESFNRLNIPLTGLDSARWLDTAAIFKAKKLKLAPMWHENHRDFARRVLSMYAPGVKFNLTLCCQEMEIDLSEVTAHRAGADVLMVLEIYKKFLEEMK